MSVQNEIERINNNVQAALSAVADAGVSVPENANSNDLPAAVLALANEKQDKLTFDATPTANSTNPVTSGGVKTELDKKASATSLGAHTGNTDNPHQVTAAQVGAISSSEKGAASGVATLGADGKVPTGQLPAMDYVPNSEKGVASGVATLGTDGKVPTGQLPAMNYAPSTHASQHATDGSDPITPASIGAAAASHNQAASTITAGTFAATGVKAMNGTDYTTARVRNIQASTTGLTAGSSALANGDIYLVYE